MTGRSWSLCGKFALVLVASVAWIEEAAAANLKLTWKDSSSNESGFKVERQTGGSFSQVATVSANVTSFTDSAVTAGITYCYRVRAFNSTGSSNPSNQACANATNPGGTVPVGGGTSGSGSGSSTGNGGSTPSGGNTSTVQIGGRWSDYRVTMKMRSDDDDGIGVMFRYVDDKNYYRFSWSVQEGYRRLEKIQNGVATVLAKDSVRYVVGRSYQLEIIARDSLLNVLIDGAMVFSDTDSSLGGGTIALYSNYNRGSVFDDIVVQDLNTGAVLLSENFNDSNFVGWTVIDDGTEEGPSIWSVKNGALAQSGNLGSYTPTRSGTYALYTKGSWTDYRATMKMRSDDDDGVGVMFRYMDNNNYYRFSWSVQEGYRRLEKIQNGVATVLAKDSVRYVVGRSYELEIIVRDSLLKVLLDGVQVFSVTDSSLGGGTIALYSNYNRGAVFDDIVVQDLNTGAVLLSENFSDGNFVGWTVVDDGTKEGPSIWSVKNGALAQSGNLGSYSPTRQGTYALY